MTAAPTAPRALFLTHGTFSHTNEQLLAAMRRARPDVGFDAFDVRSAMRGDLGAAVRSLAGAARSYGLGAFASGVPLRERFVRNRAYARVAAELVRGRLSSRRYACTIQTQSFFNGAAGSTPNFIYTDHAAVAQLDSGWGGPAPAAFAVAIEQEIFRDAAHVFSFGSQVRRSIISGCGLDPDRVSAAGCGASATPTTPPSRDLARYAGRRILFVGVDWTRKGGPDLLAALDLLRARLPDATLDIVGCDPPEARGRLGVTCHGRLTLTAVERRFQEASCFCMPSRWEPFGIVFVEAAHFALPAIGTAVGDIGDVVRDGETGWRVPPGDPAALAEALFRVLGSPETAQRMGAAAAAIAPDWTWDAVAARILDRTPLASAR
jgi:glycosyltransferase involved in cell wall biosynthesis